MSKFTWQVYKLRTVIWFTSTYQAWQIIQYLNVCSGFMLQWFYFVCKGHVLDSRSSRWYFSDSTTNKTWFWVFVSRHHLSDWKFMFELQWCFRSAINICHMAGIIDSNRFINFVPETFEGLPWMNVLFFCWGEGDLFCGRLTCPLKMNGWKMYVLYWNSPFLWDIRSFSMI